MTVKVSNLGLSVNAWYVLVEDAAIETGQRVNKWNTWRQCQL